METGSKIKMNLGGKKKCKHDWQYFRDTFRIRPGKKEEFDTLKAEYDRREAIGTVYTSIIDDLLNIFKEREKYYDTYKEMKKINALTEYGRMYICIKCEEKRELF